MAQGIYSQSVSGRRAMDMDPAIREAEADRVTLVAAVMRAITCQRSGYVLDVADAVLAGVTNMRGVEGADVMVTMTGSSFDETGGLDAVRALAEQVGGKALVIDGRDYRANGDLTSAAYQRRTLATTSAP